MRRRDFIAGLGSAATWPPAARAQQAAMPVIGFVSATAPVRIADQITAFRQGLGEAGYVNGRNVEIEYWSADDQYDRLPSLVAESIRRRVAVIVVPDTPGARAAKAATQAIPVVFLVGQDPVEAGLVSNLNGSGTNITGVSILNTGLIGKRLQLMRQMLPDVATVAALADPTNFGIVEAYAKEAATSARVLGVRLVTLNASSPIEIDAAFASLAERPPS